YIDDIKQNGSFNNGDDGVLNYSFPNNINDGEHVLRVIANGGASNFKRFATGENAAISTPEEYFSFTPHTGTITGYSNDGPKDVVIPSTIDGVPVTSIGNWAFFNKRLTRIHLPEGITSIGVRAFSNNQLTSVHIPESVIAIEDMGFFDNRLTSIHIPEGVTNIGNYTFYNNQLTSVNIPEGVTSIGNYAFYNNQLTSVNIPEGVTSIGDGAFYNNQLTSVNIPEGITSIGRLGFASNKITNVTILSRDIEFDSGVFLWNQANLKIYGFDDSTAKAYAETNRHIFISLYSTVTFQDYDGSLLKTEVVYHGEAATAPSSPTREGYTFTGWNKAFANVTTDLDVIAQYDINQYIVTFNSQGGSEVPEKTVNYSSKIIEPVSPTREGYAFVGWYKDETLTDSWSFSTDKVKENTMLYAKWLSNESNIMLASPNNVIIDEDFSETFTLSIQNNTVTKTVYASDLSLSGAFSGLSIREVSHSNHTVTASVYGSLSNTGIGTITLNPNKLAIGISPLSADVTVNPLPIPTYTVTFKDYDASILKTETVNHGEEATSPSNPTREGYTFTGWNKSFNNITSNLEVIAQYDIRQYTVIFKDHDNSVLKTEVVDHGEASTAPNNPTRSVYTFTGWDIDFTNVTSDVTITAVYTRNRRSNSSSDVNSDSRSDSNIQPVAEETGTSIIVNGQEEIAGTEVLSEINGEKRVAFKIDSNVLNQRIDQILKENESTDTAGENLLEIPITFKDVHEIQSILTGDIVEKMEQNDFSISIITEDVNYIIPAKEIGIHQIASNLNVKPESLKDIEVNVEIRKLNKAEAEEVVEKGKAQGYEVLTSPLEFRVVAKTTANTGKVKEVTVSKFSNYVSRILQIPAGIELEKITTGIVYNQDGTFSHIPTMMFSKDGKWYAKLNSLTNSSYAVIGNSIIVPTVENHWSKEYVNDMAARLVIKNPETFTPDRPITRGEFAEYITKALGIYRTDIIITTKFIDVGETDELATAITIATDYGIITGYPDNTFKPNTKISREEAMTMYAKAMDIIDLVAINNNNIEYYTDKEQIAEWAYEHVVNTVSSGVFRGKTKETIDPKGTFTYAEAVTAIRNLLRAADLIDD
ncbi:MAG: InlB B-repeat-containing protein, partial [Clostridiaceae bacterium]|nr:InlB B-repeat-containing protein [Clostridiaceae bacterium]